jgi:hypothetical protein
MKTIIWHLFHLLALTFTSLVMFIAGTGAEGLAGLIEAIH